mmetsp:Transcript_1940/g.2888  ORF Transcript_1940/g.2888 Transcript_1940/m.2888 type:complete len:111 (-) Transcript_1940:2-334(-)
MSLQTKRSKCYNKHIQRLRMLRSGCNTIDTSGLVEREVSTRPPRHATATSGTQYFDAWSIPLRRTRMRLWRLTSAFMVGLVSCVVLCILCHGWVGGWVDGWVGARARALV